MKLLWSVFCAVLLRGAMAEECPPETEKRNPAAGPFFTNYVKNALDPDFKFDFDSGNRIEVDVAMSDEHKPGFNFTSGEDEVEATTKIYGYGEDGVHTWPGKTFEVKRGVRYEVTWNNMIDPANHTLTGAAPFCDVPVVDKTLHWAYSLESTSSATIENDGVPIVTHLHGGHTNAENDGNPEFFYNHDGTVVGPQYRTTTFTYLNNLEAAALWYHDHALGITRLNVYAGMAGFYFVRDPSGDSGEYPNNLNLPAHPYEVALAIQDRMFKENGELFYPAFPGDPAYDDFITCEGVNLCNDDGTPTPEFPYDGLVENGGVCDEGKNFTESNCGPTALAEFFGDHMVVNGKVWPKMDVEPRNYRLRLLNGCDSRFLVLEFVVVGSNSVVPETNQTLDFYVIGADQGLKTKGTGNVEKQSELVMAPGERFDVILDFNPDDIDLENKRVIMKNSGGDEPFGGFPEDGSEIDTSATTNRIMAFDVLTVDELNEQEQSDDFDIDHFNKKLRSRGHAPVKGTVKRTRHVGLFEGSDEKGRLQPLLGTAEKATDYLGNPIDWPDTAVYKIEAGLVGPVEGTAGWHTQPSTENPKKNDVEIWKIWNLSADGHPIHLHLVDFEVVSRHKIINDTAAGDDNICGSDPTTGVCLQEQNIVQHDGEVSFDGGRVIKFPEHCLSTPDNCIEPALPEEDNRYTDIGYPKDIVIANPGEVTVIKAKFHQTGRYVWHCHILSHEDHEMMRVMYVGDETTTGRYLRKNE